MTNFIMIAIAAIFVVFVVLLCIVTLTGEKTNKPAKPEKPEKPTKPEKKRSAPLKFDLREKIRLPRRKVNDDDVGKPRSFKQRTLLALVASMLLLVCLVSIVFWAFNRLSADGVLNWTQVIFVVIAGLSLVAAIVLTIYFKSDKTRRNLYIAVAILAILLLLVSVLCF